MRTDTAGNPIPTRCGWCGADTDTGGICVKRCQINFINQKPETPIKPGDWVRFYQNGILVIGVVQYTHDDSMTFKRVLNTDIGETLANYVLEVRRAD